MLGEGRRPSPTVHAPPWPPYDDPAPAGVAYSLPVTGGGDYSPHLLGEGALTTLQRFLPSNDPYLSDDGGDENSDHSLSPPVDAYSCDEFRMYEFKVRRCARGRSHDWTECPYAHPGEKARRRDPRRFRYSGAACPDFRKGSCRKGEACEFAHGVFECWLHPTRYRTQPCKDGINCRRRVCFFAHTLEQLRAVPPSQQQQQSPRALPEETSYDGSPMRYQPADTYPKSLIPSPASTLNNSPPSSPPTDSPPLSPCGPYVGRASPSVADVLLSLRRLQLGAARSPPSSWLLQAGCGVGSLQGLNVRSPGFRSVPTTPTGTMPAAGQGVLIEAWEGPAERVESERDLSVRFYEKLSRESSMERRPEEEEDGGAAAAAALTPDVEWVSELVQ